MNFSDEDFDESQIQASIYSVSNFTPRTDSELEDSPVATCSSISSDASITNSIFDEVPEGELKIIPVLL